MRLNALFSLGNRDSDQRSERVRHRVTSIAAVAISAAMIAVAVPTAAVAATGDSTITVDAKALRTGDSTVGGLAGVKFGLFEGTNSSTDSPGDKVSGLWAECTTDPTGKCTITVPDTGSRGDNRDKRFWVKQLAAPTGYYLNESLVTGNNTSDGNSRFAQTPFEFRTQALRNVNVSIPRDASMPSNSNLGAPLDKTGSTSNRWTSGPAFAVSKDNNRYQPTCTTAAKVAIVLDLSLSMDGGGLAGAKTAAKAFVESLEGTGTEVALFTFSTSAPAASGNSGKNWPAEAVTASNLQTFKNRIDAYGTHGYTNWDRGLWQVAKPAGSYDLAVVLTDGNPTVYGSQGTSTWTNLQKVQEAIFSANALKHEGTQVFAFGVGSGVSGPADNLIGVSGPIEWNGQSSTVATSDYFRTDKWSTVADGLTSLAKSVTCAATIEVEKTEILANGTTQPGQGWEFTATKASGDGTLSTPAKKSTDSNAKAEWSLAFTQKAQTGSVTLNEKLTSKPGTWNLDQVTCTNKGVALHVPQSLPIELNSLAVGDYIKCSVVNKHVAAATVKVDKKWTINGGDPIANGSQPNDMSAALTLNGVATDWGTTAATFAGSTATVAETTVLPAGCVPTSQKVTKFNGATQYADVSGGKVYTSPALVAGANTITVVNAINCAVTPTITKSAGVPAQNADGSWTIDYTVTVTNPSPYVGITYDLRDTFAFGGDITLNSAAAKEETDATITAWNGADSTRLATGKALAKNGSHVYTISANATVKAGAFAKNPSTLVCDDNSVPVAGGFLNRALLTVAGTDYPAADCAEPVQPTFSKDAGTAVDNGDGTWTISYDLTVANDTGSDLFYTLTDNPAASYPAGVTILGGGVEGATSGWDPSDAATTTVVTDASLAKGATHEYTLSVLVQFDASVSDEALDCRLDGKGLNNTAQVLSGNQVLTDDACVTVALPEIEHDKSVVSASQNSDGSWTIVYDVVVTNTSEVAGVYNLTDAPAFGHGISIVSASTTGSTVSPAWDGTTNLTLATNKVLSGGASDSYRITVNATVAADVVGSKAADCTLKGNETGTGFHNVATLTTGGVDTQASDCAEPAAPNLRKGFSSSVQNADGSWDVTYRLSVQNESTSDLFYSLSDEPGFADGVDIDSILVTEPSATPSAIDWNDGDLVVDRLLPAGTTDEFIVVFTVTVPTGLSAELIDCDPQAGAGHGFFNEATMTSGADIVTDDACGPITEGVLPSIDKVVKPGFPKQLAGGNWMIEYELVVSTPESNTLVATYDLSDELMFGAGFTVQNATIDTPVGVTPVAGWNGIDNTDVATAVVLPVGESHVYTVTVEAVLDAGAASGTAAECAEDLSNGGFLNTVTLTSGSLVADDQACASPATPTFTKVVDGTPELDAIGQWTVRYLLTVTNDSSMELNYDLEDALGMPTGLDLTRVSVSGPGANAAWNGTDDTSVVQGRAIAAGSTDVFEVSVTAAVTTAASIDDVTCTAEPGHGFFNAATLTSGADIVNDQACADIPLASLTLVKVVDNSAFDGLDSEGYTFGTDQDWVLSATGEHAVPAGKSGSQAVTSVLVPAGSYTLAEEVDPASTNETLAWYTAGEWLCNDVAGDRVTLGIGDSATCTIVNAITPLDLPTLPLPPEDPETPLLPQLPTLPFTGVDAGGPLLAGALLLGLGLLLLPFRNRRRQPRH